ncbi:MAG: DUF6599 family protein [Polyangiaceae bacterium]
MNRFRRSVRAIRFLVTSSAIVSASVVSGFATSGCKDDKDATRNAPPPPPPPPPSSAPPAASAGPSGACASGGATVPDATTGAFFPRTVAAYCVDPATETVVYGPKEKHSMDEVCTTAFDGECEVYKSFGLARVVLVHYVDGAGSTGTMDVYLSQFADVAGAYGLFTKRVVADRDPADPSAPRTLEAGGAAALGTGRGYVWKGPFLAELQYGNENETPEQLAKTSEKLLTTLATELGKKIVGTTDKPASAALLPVPDRVPGGLYYHPKGFLGLSKLGDAAVGYYKKGTKRYRLVAMSRASAEAAKADAALLRTLKGSTPVADVGEEASAATLVDKSDPRSKSDYVFTRKGSFVVGVGDEDQAAGDVLGMRLSADEKKTLLKEWLTTSAFAGGAGLKPAPSATGSAKPASSK